MAGQAPGEQVRRACAEIVAAWGQSPDPSWCAPCLGVLPVSGAAVSLLAGGNQVTLCATDKVAALVDELQFDLGEGPGWQAVEAGLPVLVPQLRGRSGHRWPLLAEALRESPVEAIFAFPLRIGPVRLGALDLYQTLPGPLPSVAVRDAAALARALSQAVARRLLEDDPSRWTEDGPSRDGSSPDGADPAWGAVGSRREVHQAIGMVLAQLSAAPADALAVLRAHAYAEGRPMIDVARDVVARRLHFGGPALP